MQISLRVLGLLILAGLVGACSRTRALDPGQGVSLSWELPVGFVLNEQAPSTLTLSPWTAPGQKIREWGQAELQTGRLEFTVPESSAGQQLLLEGRFYLCQKTDAKICTQVRHEERFDVRTSPGKPSGGIHWVLKTRQ